MEQIVKAGIIKQETKEEYQGNVSITPHQSLTKVEYNLINQKNPSDYYKGGFEGNFNTLASIIKKLDAIINTIIEPQ